MLKSISLAATIAIGGLLTSSALAQQLPVAHQQQVTAQGKPLTLLGHAVKVGDQAPTFTVVDQSFKPVSLSDLNDKPLLISVVPSIDTGVCSIQTKHFNQAVEELPKAVTLVTISTDLPFAQKRFCGAEGIESMQVLSDAVWRSFGESYGVLIKDMGLLSRAIFVIDQQGKISYQELVPELGQEPNYDQALAALQKLL